MGSFGKKRCSHPATKSYRKPIYSIKWAQGPNLLNHLLPVTTSAMSINDAAQELRDDECKANCSQSPKRAEEYWTANRGGKAVARMNALSHGLRAEHLLIPGEDAAEFSQLREHLFEQFQPEGALEAQLVDEILAGLWRKRRLVRVEAGILAQQMFRDDRHSWLWNANRDDEDDQGDLTEKVRASLELVALGQAYSRSTSPLSKLSRYETGISRNTQRAVQELQRLQAAREKEAMEQQVILDVSMPSRDRA